MEGKNRKTGIDAVGDVSWGTHLFQFYQIQKDLIDIWVPYFKTGLENNEFCLCVTSEPLTEKEVENEMRKAMPDFDRYLKKGQIEIVPHQEWYLRGGTFNVERILKAGIDKLNLVLSMGYEGIRAAGNIARLEKRLWGKIVDYEEELNNVIGKYRMIALCAYPLDPCGVSEVIDVIHHHPFVLIKRKGEWELIENSDRKWAEEVLQKSEEAANRLVRENEIIAEIGRIISLTLNIEEVYERFVEEIRKLISFDRIAIKIINHQEKTVSVPYVIGVDMADNRFGDVFPLSGSYTEEVMLARSGLLVQTEDIDELKSRFPNLVVTLMPELRSMISVPLISKNQVIGALHLRSKKPNAYTEVDLRVAERVGNQIAGAIANAQLFAERKRAEEALRNEKQRFQTLTENAPFGMVMIDKNGTYRYINSKFKELFGYDLNDIPDGRTWVKKAFPDPTYRDHVISTWVNDLKRFNPGETRSKTVTVTCKDGTEKIINFIPVQLETGENLVACEDITEQTKVERLLRQSEEKYRAIFEESKDVIFIITPAGKILDINPAGVELFGYSSKEELLKIDIAQDLYVHPEDREKIEQKLEKEGYVKDYELVMKRKNGEGIVVQETSTAIRDEQGNLIAYRGMMRDVTTRKNLEEKLLQSQKMEAVGILAGGVAHDFNNMLTVILGNVRLGLMGLEPTHPLYEILSKIQEGANRASDFTKQLLAFSRRQKIQPKVLDVDQLIANFSKMLSRLIGEDIEIKIELGMEVGHVYADPAALDQVMINLGVNARDAMPKGGTLTIQTQNVWLDKTFCRLHPFVKPGGYVKISFIDTGGGIDEWTLQRIFEPFFSTKKQGVGLGLAVVYGIVKQHGGYIIASSQLGEGTRFDAYLPLSSEPMIQEVMEVVDEVLPRGKETILIAEDEKEVGELFRTFLEKLGYKVFLTQDGKEALEVFSANHQAIDLVILDAVMPKFSGPKVYDQMRFICGNLPCLFITGYGEENVQRYFDNILEVPILRKPITFHQFGRKVREILDQTVRNKGNPSS